MKYHLAPDWILDAKKAYLARYETMPFSETPKIHSIDTIKATCMGRWYEQSESLPSDIVEKFYKYMGESPSKNFKCMDDFFGVALCALNGSAHDPMKKALGLFGRPSSIIHSYYDMAYETCKQFEFLVKEYGLFCEFYTGEGEPYKNSEDMVKDLHKGHLYIFATLNAFGDHETEEQNLLLTPAPSTFGGFDAHGLPVTVNDLFRAVHDVFGHGCYGNGFGPVGEDMAWRVHSSMYSPSAVMAMTTETRGQNSWVNYGPHIVRPDDTIPVKGDPDYIEPSKRPFAKQKNQLAAYWMLIE